jgi:hypothetical protein
MIDPYWTFVGILTGLLVVSIFVPPNLKDKQLPTPGDTSVFRTDNGCVRFTSEEVPCSAKATSLNFIASTK